MATRVVDKENGSNKARNNADTWKFPNIPIYKIYKKNPFRIFPSYAIKDFEQTTAFKLDDKFRSFKLICSELLDGCFVNKKHKFLHLGLVQVSIKPLVRDGVETPIIVYLRDSRHQNFKNSLLAVVSTNLSEGAFYFNCFPGFSVSLTDSSLAEVLTLRMKATGVPTGISVALSVRVVCKAMVDLSAEYLEAPVFGRTDYFHIASGASAFTQWDGVVDDQDHSSVVQGSSVGRSSNTVARTYVGTQQHSGSLTSPPTAN
ncbi:hypothetical protein vseg_016652 [Gypsophila vaccaria]